jgi:hypothetical protein
MSTSSSSITRAACELLNSALTQRDWSDKRKDIISAGKLSARLEEFTITRPVFDGAIANGQPVDPAAASRFADVSKLWERDNVTISFSDPEFQACIVCLKHFSDKRSLPGNRYSAELLELFKLTD